MNEQKDTKTLQYSPLNTGWIRDAECDRNVDCTSSGLRWGAIKKHNRSVGCKILKGKRVLFIGDSFIRHAYTSFVLWLSGNYVNGALIPEHDPICVGMGQFEEKKCRKQVARSKTICGVEVALQHGTHWEIISLSNISKSDFIVWGNGNHPVDANYTTRLGVNDAPIVQQHRLGPTCGALSREETSSKVIWLDTHARLKNRYADESRAQLQKYHELMPAALEKECGITKVASVWDMTCNLIDYHSQDAALLSWDGGHWNGIVNSYKAYAIFEQMLLDESNSYQ